MKPGHTDLRLSNGMRHQPRKRFGQNFLHDQTVIDKIIAAINPKPDDHLVEIGPGQGAITAPLAASGAPLDCIELDRDLASFLTTQFQALDHVTVHQQDVLKFHIAKLSTVPHSMRVIGNLPYNISTPVLFHLLKSHSLIRDMTFMLQLEVVQRMSAGVGDKNYGRLGIMLQYFCQVEHLFNVPSTAFTPQPKVSSAIVRLTPHQDMPLVADDVKSLEIIVRNAFNQRRKTLKNSLKDITSGLDLGGLGIDLSLRPENLSLAEYVVISNAVNAANPK
ncbi:MAG: 16S rRNA (adenine1518-N6/adenine1519-N6)-dimethyltransferase [Pseudohongiellaceae bacterium]|jgi:16S rRNA (adenine1518-N6/adenine1519-N6)-dimethyltransferase